MLDLPSREILVSAGLGVLNAIVSVLVALLILPMAEAFTGKIDGLLPNR